MIATPGLSWPQPYSLSLLAFATESEHFLDLSRHIFTAVRSGRSLTVRFR